MQQVGDHLHKTEEIRLWRRQLLCKHLFVNKKNYHAFDDDDNVDHENFEKHMASTSKTEQGSCQLIKVLSGSEQEPKKMDDLMAALHSSSIKFAKSPDRGRI